MSFLFGKKKTPQEMLRANQRALNRAIRELDRERTRMENQEKKVIADIKNMAKQNQMEAVKIMAKDLVRVKRFIRQFILMRANLQSVSLKIQTLKSTNDMSMAMKGVSVAMKRMNKQMNLSSTQKILMEFEKESEIMEAKGEMMEDTIDTAIGQEEDDDESEMVVNKLLNELGISLNQEISAIPAVNNGAQQQTTQEKQKTALPVSSNATTTKEDKNTVNVSDLDELEARLTRLTGYDQNNNK